MTQEETSGASTGGGAAPTDGTQRALTEDLLKDVLQLMFASGAEPKHGNLWSC